MCTHTHTPTHTLLCGCLSSVAVHGHVYLPRLVTHLDQASASLRAIYTSLVQLKRVDPTLTADGSEQLVAQYIARGFPVVLGTSRFVLLWNSGRT